MFKSRSQPIRPSEITDESVWRARRRLLLQAPGALALAASLPGPAQAVPVGQALPFTPSQRWKLDDTPTSESDITSYNNFYEFGTGKEDPARHSGQFKTEPWTLQIDGLVHKPLTLDMDQILKLAPLEERIYRLRCVEAWSMVVPWVGYSLSALLKQAEPQGSARFVRFETAADPETMPGLRSRILNWPYVEALRLDEAMHPLTLLATGLYGKSLPVQNGAPVRLIVPWKYGFKSAKSLVRITLTDTMPESSWMKVAPHEYGFYANVNPEVPHPRWSQATERVIGSGFFATKKPTLPFNGYAEDVAGLYADMDLRRNY
ncbi:protein-methionine-sulfoxide reductase catalytic subunit MsrP [Alcaligenes faecalis]|uniref:Protein-methionine-sulfoxide reductase catalytic subunit MsrP n=1 Tax=Alcaligenes faecalis TaxID=511 RepID=A0ABY7MZE2_ALCFA|nr:protein-methionine-sulfoxide reductase catalytic subunit MsrP [Alcaligenes faecalis]ALO37394.1 sulfoxide reductase catalytic subunit YedY [Alcaligenes faecalis]MBH0311817.1 protein-methionine-sulfoxide reductase catalytic subunit MsrP [Alcaligenes faecalis]MBW4787854.1 protein-methionine-sulfoxide reductase catalytic subunit MsrP [Alcaligenes faecalis subsp. faecalis]RSE63818.1 protein-methionine-sulfoxide reductase catalytic subunit MsrP [Alcaligenes faecalis]WBM37011.1 protein-methionine-